MVRFITYEQAAGHLDAVRGAHPGRFSPRELDEIFVDHLRAEQSLDIDAVMATVAPDAIYESHPLGLVLWGQDAIREYYDRFLPPYMSRVRRSGFRLRAYGESSVVIEATLEIRKADTSWGRCFRTGVIEFDGR